MLDKKNRKYFDYWLSLEVGRFTGAVTFNWHKGTVGNAQKEIGVMPGVKQKERVKLR